MKKRLIALVLAVVMVFALASCGDKKTSNDSIPTLTWLVPGDSQSDLQSVVDEINKITEEKIGARVDIQFIDAGSFAEKMKMNMASGADFDICFAGYCNNYLSAVNNGGLMDITDMIDKVDGLREAIPDYVWEIAAVDGRIYGVPNIQIMATATSMVAFTDIADKYDFDFSKVKKIGDIEPYLEMVKNGEKGIYPYRPDYGFLPWTNPVYENIGSVTNMIVFPKGATSADELTYVYETPEFKEGVNTLWDWYQKGYIRPDALSVGDDTNDLHNGKYAVAQEVWKPGVEQAFETSTGLKNKFVPLEDPFLKKTSGLTTMAALGANCPNPEKSLEFIKLLNTDVELYNLVCFGIEGKHYDMVDGRVRVKADAGYNQNGGSWKFGNTFNAYLMEGQDDDVWTETERVNNEATRSTILGFVFDNSKVKTQLSNLATVVSEYEAMNKGVKDPDTYMPEFKKKLKQAGIEEVYEEVKRQLDDYFKSQK